MPELPEVETTKRGLIPHINQQTVDRVIIHQNSLRWPVSSNLPSLLNNQQLLTIERRAKYLLFRFAHGTLIAHLGMSGSLRIVSTTDPLKKHDHIEIYFNNNKILRYNDPRRFGAMLWTEDDPHTHPLLAKLGPEPLSHDFTDQYLLTAALKRKIHVKQLIMDSRVVVGVGNIYAIESLFIARIHPLRAANTLTQKEASKLVSTIREILTQAIIKGGTTLRDFVNSDGKPGYFKQSLLAYGREKLPCKECQRPLELTKINNRATVYCTKCQK